MEWTKYTKGSRLFKSSYIIDDFISAEGATGQVYLVHREDDADKKFAAKIIYCQDNFTEEFWKKFAAEEVTSLRIMNQEGLVQTYETFNVDTEEVKAKVLIMEYVEGVSLKEYIYEHGCIIPKVALNIFLKILSAIKILHNYKHIIIHRDLKPGNIIISKDLSKITILDFGISTVMQIAQDNLEKKNIKCFTQEDEHNAHGTPPYLIPDSLVRKKGEETNATVQFDFYSLGVILYEMIMGERPFDYDKLPQGTSGQNRVKLALKYDMYNISSNPTITPTIENMIFRCLACMPEDLKFRYNNIDELIADCKKSIESLNHHNDSTPLLKPINKRKYPRFGRLDPDVFKDRQPIYKRWTFFFIILAAGLAVLIVALVLFFVL